MPVTINLETDLTVRGKDVSTLVDAALSQWSGVTEANVSFTKGTLGADIDNTNICCYFYDSSICPNGPQSDGMNPLIIDADGAITSDFFNPQNKLTTLGFASIILSDSSSGAAVKGEAVFNASCLAGVEVTGCSAKGLSFTDDDFTSFMVHEMGHFLGLDHSQVNLTEATDGVTSNDDVINTMFPTFIIGNGANFKTPEKDDKVGLAQLYPSSTFATTTWTIKGTVSNGSAGLQCANVIARNQAAGLSRTDAISALSGDFSPAGTADGSYVIPGLTPGVTYTVEIERIGNSVKEFTGSSGYTPCRGSSGESKPPKFDAQIHTGTFTGTSGSTILGVDFSAANVTSTLELASLETMITGTNDELVIEDQMTAIELKSDTSSSCSSSGSGGSSGSSGSTSSNSSGCSLIPSF